MMLIKISDRTWLNPETVTYVYQNSDEDAIVGCGGGDFTIARDANEIVDAINEAIAINAAFEKVK